MNYYNLFNVITQYDELLFDNVKNYMAKPLTTIYILLASKTQNALNWQREYS